jgi:hypothetical protein
MVDGFQLGIGVLGYDLVSSHDQKEFEGLVATADYDVAIQWQGGEWKEPNPPTCIVRLAQKYGRTEPILVFLNHKFVTRANYADYGYADWLYAPYEAEHLVQTIAKHAGKRSRRHR